MSLDLYARVEFFIGFDDAYEELYDTYLNHLAKLDISTILDVGCGSGKLLERLKSYDAFGIDLSKEMIRQTVSKGLNVCQINVCDLDAKYDVVLCVADVLNYLTMAELTTFLQCVADRLKPNGYFLCDVNTLYGFENVAVGAMVRNFNDISKG